jgi:hypothetical protein
MSNHCSSSQARRRVDQLLVASGEKVLLTSDLWPARTFLALKSVDRCFTRDIGDTILSWNYWSHVRGRTLCRNGHFPWSHAQKRRSILRHNLRSMSVSCPARYQKLMRFL